MHREKLLFISVACIIAFSLPLRGKSDKYIHICDLVSHFAFASYSNSRVNGKSEIERALIAN